MKQITQLFPDKSTSEIKINSETDVVEIIHDFSQKFKTESNSFKFINNGLFGYMAYDAVRYFEDISNH